MSAIKNKRIIIDVTRGDCVDDNRKSGKSNTGTYFISSLKNYDDFKEFFDENNKYVFNVLKIEIYNVLFEKYFMKYKEEYVGKMNNFTSYISYLLSLKVNPKTELTVRKNDSRVFMRFVDNTDKIVNAFRCILYEDLSLIVIENINGIFNVYPIINERFIQDRVDQTTGLIVDE